MKVLKDNYNKNAYNRMEEESYYPRKMFCEWCGSELEYDKSDIKHGFLGLVFVDCPLCSKRTIAEDDKNELRLTVDNVEFPTHFSCTSKETGAKETCTNEYVKECIYNGIKYFRENKDEFSWYAQTGDTRVTVTRWSGDEAYEVVVANRFYTTEIPFEGIDY